MIFNSIEFVLFFLIVTSLYFALPHRFRWFLLLVASCYFYMAFVPVYILILGFTIVVDYFAGLLIEQHTGQRRKWFLIASLVANVGVLAFFKYYNFLNENLTALLGLWNRPNPIPELAILLPVGLSFHTFQAMSYTIEVYRGNQKAERHFGIYALYVMFYPQLVAGPIERPQNVLPQFYERHTFNYIDAIEGLKRILWGMVKKIVIADRLAIYVDTVFSNAEHHNGITFVVAAVFFAFQVYCDFSGYSDIAIGSARVMGFRLMENFKWPYFARSVSEFWAKWHISLQTWFRDYVYIPLGGNRVSTALRYRNLLFIFLLSGLWHGAKWTYVLWGGINGVYLVSALLIDQAKQKWPSVFALSIPPLIRTVYDVTVTFAMICFGYIIFCSKSLSDAVMIVGKLTSLSGPVYINNLSAFIYSLLGIGLLLAYEIKHNYYPGKLPLFHSSHWLVRQASYATAIILILLFGVFDGGQFIYFQF